MLGTGLSKHGSSSSDLWSTIKTAMAFWVYILRCSDGSYYVGHTDDLEQHVSQHQSGELGGYTAHRLPVQLAYSNEYTTRDEAFAAERQIKGWSRKKKEALMRADWEELQRLAPGRSRGHPSTGTLRAQGERNPIRHRTHGTQY